MQSKDVDLEDPFLDKFNNRLESKKQFYSNKKTNHIQSLKKLKFGIMF